MTLQSSGSFSQADTSEVQVSPLATYKLYIRFGAIMRLKEPSHLAFSLTISVNILMIYFKVRRSSRRSGFIPLIKDDLLGVLGFQFILSLDLSLQVFNLHSF